MPIRTQCPHCQKAFRVKDELAGKKVTCPGCKKVVPVAAAVMTGEQAAVKGAEQFELETLAAEALSEQKLQEAVKEPLFVEFLCPQCDAELKLSADLAGKQSPCPECRRIIKVPHLQKQAPKDWRQAGQENVPAAVALMKPQEQLEGAWGSVQATKVSRDALIEAKVITEPKRRWTRAEKIRTGVMALGACLFLFVAYWALNRWMTENFEARVLSEIEAYTQAAARDGAPSKVQLLSVEGQVELLRLLGDYYLAQAKVPKKQAAKDGKALHRAALQNLKREGNLWVRWFLVRESLPSLLKAEPSLDELADYLQLAPGNAARLVLLRELMRQKIEPLAEKPDELKQRVPEWKGMIQRAFPALPDATGRPNPSEQVAGLSLLGQELVWLGHKPLAIPVIEEASRLLGQQPLIPMAHAVALVMIGRQPPPGMPQLDAQYAKIEGLARLKLLRDAMEQFGQRTETDSAEDIELRTTLSLLFQEKQPEQSKKFLEKAIDIAKRRPEADWQRIYLCLTSLQVNGPEFANRLAEQLLAGPILSRLHYASFQHVMEVQPDLADAAKAEAVKPTGAATSLAYFQIAIRQARQDASKTLAWARALEREADRPFAMLGVLFAQLEKP